MIALPFVILAAFLVFAVGYFRASRDKRTEWIGLKRSKRALIGIAALVVMVSAALYSLFGSDGMRATSAAKDYLRGQFGESDGWKISLNTHTQRSEKPKAGVYDFTYRYGKREGRLDVEYFERDGELVLNVVPK